MLRIRSRLAESAWLLLTKGVLPLTIHPGLACLWLLWAMAAQPVHAAPKKVLLLNSYHSGYEWTDDVVRGVAIAFSNINPAVELHIEYMDARRHEAPEELASVAEFYKKKFAGMHFDAIVASDDVAVHFLLDRHSEMFPGVPVVVCGVNEYRGSSRYLTSAPETRDWLTGVLETIDIEDTANLVLRLHPETRMIVSIGDGSNVSYVEDLERAHPSIEVRRLHTQNLTLEQLGAQLSALPSDSIVIMSAFSRDRANHQLTMADSVRFVCSRSPVPVYSLNKNALGSGIVGGRLTDGYFQGLEAGKMAVAILNGVKPSSIPIRSESSNRYMFDQRELRRWGISEDALPKDSVIIEKSTAFYDRHATAVWLTFGFILVQAVIISLLAANIARRRRIQQALAESEVRFRNIFETSRDAIGVSVGDRYAYVNPAWAEMFGYSDPIELVGISLYDLIPLETHDEVRERRRTRSYKETEHAIYRSKGLRRDGSIIDTEVRASIFDVKGKWYTTAILRDITAEKRAEETLRESERDRDVALQAARMGTWRWDRHTDLASWSPVQESLFGLPKGSYDGTQKMFLDRVHPDDREAVTEAVTHAVESGSDYRMEYRVIWKDGSQHWIVGQGKVFLESDGLPRGITGVSWDTTERREAEDRIRYQLQLNQAITNYAAESLFMTDSQGRVTFMNPAAERTFGWTEQELLGQVFHDIFHHSSDGLQCKLEDCPASSGFGPAETVRDYEDVFFHKNGTPVDVIRSKTPILQDGQVTGAVMVVHDITESKKAAQEIRRQEDQFRRIFEDSPVGMAVLGPDHRFQMLNHALLHMLAYSSEEELIGRTYQDVTHPEDVDLGLTEAVQFTRNEITRFQLEKRYLSKNGDTIWANLNVSSFRNSFGGVGSRFIIVENITERKLAEKELARQAHELALSNADLQQFAYVTSHDLQEPLRNIAAFSQMLGRRYTGRLDSDADEFIGYIVTGVNRMRSLIDDLLGYSRVVNSERVPFSPVDMGQAVEWAVNNLRQSVESTGAVIHRNGLPAIAGDRILLVQLFQNLIGNAIKYRNGPQPEIQVSAVRDETGWVFSVKDNGIGIAPHHHERIFGVFKRLHGNEFPGTGIGLAICRKIVEKHNGRIWVESEEGKGADFRFTLGL